MSLELPVAGTAPPERIDAARNRERVAEAAAKLFRECEEPAQVDMRAIAAEAGVGVGTLYRRFGDKIGLASSILDLDARELQEAILSGPAPLGPGAPAPERVDAFLAALVEHTEQGVELAFALEQLGGFGLGPYPAWRLHLRVLLEQLEPGFDVDWLAEALLAPLHPALYRAQRRRGLTPGEITQQLTQLARAVYGSRA